VNPRVAELLSSSGASAVAITKNATFRDLKITPDIESRLRLNQPLRSDDVQQLTTDGKLQRVKLTEGGEVDARQIYHFYGQSSAAINIQNGYVYAAQRSSTPVLGITLSRVQQQQPMFQQQQQPMFQQQQPLIQQQQQPVFQQQPRAYSQVPPSTVSNYGFRNAQQNVRSVSSYASVPRTDISALRGGNKNNRKTRRFKKRGGGQTWYEVHITNLLTCSSVPCADLDMFYLDSNGNTATRDEWRQLQSGVSMAFKTFADRMEPHFSSSAIQKVETEEPRETGVSVPVGAFLPLGKADADTYKRLVNLRKAIETSADGTAPAQFRAFLLATRMDASIAGAPLHNMFCGDSWRERRATETPCYALLNALYSDRKDGTRESYTADECRNTVASFVGAKIMNSAAPSGGSVDSFENVKFPALPSALDGYCKQLDYPVAVKNSGNRTTVLADDKAILMNAHKQLRDLYDAQLEVTADIIKRVVIPKRTGYSSTPELLLADEFGKDPRGSLVLLEEIIKDARGKLAAHYMAVEKVYQGAIVDLTKRVRGQASTTVKNT